MRWTLLICTACSKCRTTLALSYCKCASRWMPRRRDGSDNLTLDLVSPSQTQSSNNLEAKISFKKVQDNKWTIKTAISVRLVPLIVTRGWAKSPQTCTDQPTMKPYLKPPVLCAQQSALTSNEVDMLELKRNPSQFGKQEDWAAGLGVQVEIEFHHVWRLQKLPLGSLWVFQSSPQAPAMLGLPRNSASQLRGAAAFKRWRQFKDNRLTGLSSPTCGPCWTQRCVNSAEIITGLFSSRLWPRGL